MDTATGLLYVGNGQYYDPETGRFLNRNAKPEQNNPYIPWGGNPSSALIAPLALLVLVFGRKKTRSKWDNLVIILVLALAIGMSLSACGGQGQNGQGQPDAPATNTNGNNTDGGPANDPGSTPQPGGAPSSAATATCTPTPTLTPTTMPSLHFRDGYYDWENAVLYASTHWNSYENAESSDCTNFVSFALRDGGLLETDEWKPEPKQNAWVGTPDLYKFLSSKFNVITFENPKRENLLRRKILRENEDWTVFIESNQQNILPGDIVFYYDAEWDWWGHAAIVGDLLPETSYVYEKTGISIHLPRIYEHSGPDLDGNPQPRSLDDSSNEWISKVAIVQIRPRK
jgi:hypothetical protein